MTAALTVAPPVPTYLSISPGSVTGGQSVSGTVFLTGPAPAGGTNVSLSTSAPASVAAFVTVPQGNSSQGFVVQTQPVASATTVTVSGTAGGATASGSLTVNPPAVYGLTLSSYTSGPGSVTGTVTLNGLAPVGGFVVSLSSSVPTAGAVPSTVTVAARNTAATFPITLSPVTSSTVVVITAKAGGVSQSSSLTVQAPSVVALRLSANPTTVTGGYDSTGTVTLSGPAPTGGAVVTLTSTNILAYMPLSVTVQAGQSSASFPIHTHAATSSTVATLYANYGTQVSTKITIAPGATAALSGLTLSASHASGPGSVTGTVTLTGSAPVGGFVVSLSSSASTVGAVPSTVTVAAGNTAATFSITLAPVTTSTVVVITAQAGGLSQTSSLTDQASTLAAVSISANPITVVGGLDSTGTVTLSGPAPTGGVVVALTTTNILAYLPLSVTVQAGKSSATFPIHTHPVTSSTVAKLYANYGAQVTSIITITPGPVAALSGVSLSVSHATGPGTVTGTVTLTGPAPAGGFTVSLSSSVPTVGAVPSTVTAAAGNTTATFPITLSSVTTSTVVVITAQAGGLSQTSSLTVQSGSLVAVSISANPVTVVGGLDSTGTVTLSGPAPTGGVVVALTTTNILAYLPLSVTVQGGKSSATFPIHTHPVTSSTIAKLYAKYGAQVTGSVTIVPGG